MSYMYEHGVESYPSDRHVASMLYSFGSRVAASAAMASSRSQESSRVSMKGDGVFSI